MDEAIQYLLPSHLTEKDARPNMKHPYDLFPTFMKSQADANGRPKHAAFFMRRPVFHDLNFQIWCHLERLNEMEKEQPSVQPPVSHTDASSRWVNFVNYKSVSSLGIDIK